MSPRIAEADRQVERGCAGRLRLQEGRDRHDAYSAPGAQRRSLRLQPRRDHLGPCRHAWLLRRAARSASPTAPSTRASTPSSRPDLPPPPRAAPAAGARARRRAMMLSDRRRSSHDQAQQDPARHPQRRRRSAPTWSVLPLPDGLTLKGGALNKVMDSLRNRGLIRVTRRPTADPSGSVITSEGMAAIGVEAGRRRGAGGRRHGPDVGRGRQCGRRPGARQRGRQRGQPAKPSRPRARRRPDHAGQAAKAAGGRPRSPRRAPAPSRP